MEIFKKSVLLFLCTPCFYGFNTDIVKKYIEIGQRRIANDALQIPTPCLDQLKVYGDALWSHPFYSTHWSWQLFDASSKWPSGMLTGQIVDIGNFDECLHVDIEEQGVDIKGKYCLAALIIPNTLLASGFSFNNLPRNVITKDLLIYSPSICIPNQCKPSDLLEVLGLPEQLAKDLSNNNYCQSKETIPNFDGGDWCFVAFLIVILNLVLCSTVYDFYSRKSDKKPLHPLLLCFSLYTNGLKLLQTKTSSDQLISVNGLKAISIFWIIIGHRYFLMISLPHQNFYEIFNWSTREYSEYIQGGLLAVDTFIFITGLLMSYGFINLQSKPGSKFNIIIFYVHRYLRLTPALAVLFFFTVTIYKHFGTGPAWELHNRPIIDNCVNNWWSYFIYLQNYINMTEICLPHTWYLSMDMQIYILSPIILIPLVKYPKYAFYALIVLTLVSIIPPILVLYINDVSIQGQEYQELYYPKTHNRTSPWFIGVLLGYLLVKYKDKKIKIHWMMNLFLWTIVLIGMCLILHFFLYFSVHHDRNGTALYVGVHRMLWAICLMWVVFACHRGYGGIINWFLTLPLFTVIAKLSYSMYLIHYVILLIAVNRIKSALYWDDYDLLIMSLGDVVAIAFVSIFWSLFFEYPLVIAEKYIFAKLKTKSKTVNQDINAFTESNVA